MESEFVSNVLICSLLRVEENRLNRRGSNSLSNRALRNSAKMKHQSEINVSVLRIKLK